MSEEQKGKVGKEEAVDSATLVARQLQEDLKERLNKLLADPRTPQAFKDAFNRA